MHPIQCVRLALAMIAATPLALASQSKGGAENGEASAPAGLFFGVDPITYASVNSEYLTNGRSEGGFGLALRFGWAVSPRVAMLLEVPVARVSLGDTAEYYLSHGDIALRFAPWAAAQPRAVQPFVQVGAGFREVSSTFYQGGRPAPYALSGENFSIGGGLTWRVTPRLDIAMSAAWSSGVFNDERRADTTVHNRGIRATSARAQLGLDWYRRRR